MNPQSLALLLQALSGPGAAFILGAGASAPAVPTFVQLAAAIAKYADRLTGFPGSTIARSGLRDLMQPVIEQAQHSSDLTQWKAGSMTTATIAAILEHMISRAHRLTLPQYQVFSLFPLSSTIVSFNWDGLALARCPQRLVIHPHGTVEPRTLNTDQFDELLFVTQGIDEPGARHWYVPGLVLPGEETGPALQAVREEVLARWLSADSFVIVGYTFGIASHVAYDEVWLDTFAEACSRNAEVPVHILAPDANAIAGALCERLKRRINVFAWPVRWDVLSSVLLKQAFGHPVPLAAVRLNVGQLMHMVRDLEEAAEKVVPSISGQRMW